MLNITAAKVDLAGRQWYVYVVGIGIGAYRKSARYARLR